MHRALTILSDAVTAHAFPGAQFAVTHRGALISSGAVGRFTYNASSPAVTPRTVYDIASLTKVVAATPMAMLLCEEGKLDLERPVGEIVPEFLEADPDKRRCAVTLRMLLAHSSGLPAYVRLFETARTRDALLAALYKLPLETGPLQRVEYSDVGFILLGEALERLAGERIDSFVQRRVFMPLAMDDTRYLPPPEWHTRISPTDDASDFRHRLLQGEVHDENCSVMGGISAHAGVFSTAQDLARLALCMLSAGSPVFTRSVLAKFTRREELPAGTTRALGWDTPSRPSSSGEFFSLSSFGHLGYTGCSLWIDPEADLSITLLTNRVWPDRSSHQIRELRPRFHDAVRQEFGLAAKPPVATESL